MTTTDVLRPGADGVGADGVGADGAGTAVDAGPGWVRSFPAGDVPGLAGDVAVVERWLREQISAPHPDLGRSGPVCPFVPRALKTDSVQLSLHYEVDGHTPEDLRRVVEAELADFGADPAPVPTSGVSLISRVVVFPALDPACYKVLDAVYGDLKDRAVAQGLMVGQFHPDCDERAVRNPAFPVSKSPVALVAMRRMAPHDVLFLNQRADWFGIYDARFREHFERGRIHDPLMRDLYRGAVERHGLAPLSA